MSRRKSRWASKRRQSQSRWGILVAALLGLAVLGVLGYARLVQPAYTVTEAEFHSAAERSLTKLCQFYTDLCLPGYVEQSLERIHFVHQAEFDERLREYIAAVSLPPEQDVPAFTVADEARQIYFNVDYPRFRKLPTKEDFLAATEEVFDHEVVHQTASYYELPGSVVIPLGPDQVFTATTVSGVALVDAQGVMILNPLDEAFTEYLASPIHRSRHLLPNRVLLEGPALVESISGELGFGRQLIMTGYALYGWSGLALLYGEKASPAAMGQLGLDEFWMGVNFLVLLNNAVVDLAGGEVDQEAALAGLEIFLDSGGHRQP